MSVLTVEEWRASIDPLPIARLSAFSGARGEKAFRDAFGDRFLVRRFDPNEIRIKTTVTVTQIDPTLVPRAAPEWVYLVASSNRSAFTNFISIGRAKNNDVVLDDASISRFHAMLVETPAGIAIFDAGSKHGSFVDGQKAPRQGTGAALTMRCGAVLRLGAIEMTFVDAATLVKSTT